MGKRRGRIPKKVAQQLQKEAEKKKRARALIVRDLEAACIWGGNLSEIRKLLGLHEYTVEELQKAIKVLNTSCSSGLEAIMSRESISFLENYIKNK